jgi:hypothetical protein
MQSQERDRIAAFLDNEVANGVSSEVVASWVATIFEGIDQALNPIIGQRGMAALYKRSLHLSRPLHLWLPVAAEEGEARMDLVSLTAALATQTAVEAAAAGTLLLASLHALLTTLIGELLTERLLRPVWATFLSAPSARDMKS